MKESRREIEDCRIFCADSNDSWVIDTRNSSRCLSFDIPSGSLAIDHFSEETEYESTAELGFS